MKPFRIKYRLPKRFRLTPEVKARFCAYLATHDMWGSLHVVLDDDNWETHFVEFCVKDAEKRNDPEGAALGRLLLGMTRTQRLKLGRIGYGYSQ